MKSEMFPVRVLTSSERHRIEAASKECDELIAKVEKPLKAALAKLAPSQDESLPQRCARINAIKAAYERAVAVLEDRTASLPCSKRMWDDNVRIRHMLKTAHDAELFARKAWLDSLPVLSPDEEDRYDAHSTALRRLRFAEARFDQHLERAYEARQPFTSFLDGMIVEITKLSKEAGG